MVKKEFRIVWFKPISAIVDVTNYVMFDLNRPMHAYDANKLDGNIIVREAKNGESFDALDEKKYKIVGDINFEKVINASQKITPVPGGVGPMTINTLMYNTILSMEKSNNG